VKIADARPGDVRALATLLFDGFREHWSDAWLTIDEATAEVHEALTPDRICRVAFDGEEPVGWIGGFHDYQRVWQLHPLVVRADRQRRGVGRALVRDLEVLVAARGALTLTVGSDDMDNMTSLGGEDLYPDPLAHLAAITDRKGHPFEFYRALGFAVIGVVPDANGFGRPDIILGKRVQE